MQKRNQYLWDEIIEQVCALHSGSSCGRIREMAIPVVKYLRDVKIELTKVTYPERDEVIRLTALVIVISLIIGAYLGALDYVFTIFLEYIIQ